jgi:hypothetical protein
VKIQSSLSSQQFALMLSAAVCERFPSAQIVSVAAHSDTFAIDVIIDSPWDRGFMPLIEKQCIELCAQNLEFEPLEMTPAVVAGLFAQNGQKILVDILRADSWALPMKFHPSAPKSYEFVLDEPKQVGKHIFRFRGALGKSATFPDYYSFDGLRQEENGYSYLPKGEKLRKQLLEFWNRIVGENNFEIVSTPQGVVWEESGEQLANLGIRRVAQVNYLLHTPPHLDYGILTPTSGFQDQFYLETSDADVLDTVISSLQMMREISKIFCFETQTILRLSFGTQDEKVVRRALESEIYEVEPDPNGKGAKIEFRLIDIDGFAWTGPVLEIKRAKGSKRGVLGSLFGPWERFIALALQKEQGVPFKLAEEQARLLMIRPEFRMYAEEVLLGLKKLGLRVRIDETEGTLSERVHIALKEEVPYIVVIGPKEVAERKVSWRESRAGVETITTLDEFLQRMQKVKL